MAHMLHQRAAVFGSRQCSLRGSQAGLQPHKGGAPRVVMMAKKDLHPKWYEEAVVTCNGEEVLKTSGTQPTYTVDIWSGNHPFYQGMTGTMVTDEGRVNRFKRRFAGLDSLAAGVATLKTATADRQKALEAAKQELNPSKGGTPPKKKK